MNNSETQHREKIEQAMAVLDNQMKEISKQIDDRRDTTPDTMTQRCLEFEEMYGQIIDSDEVDSISINSQAEPITVLSNKENATKMSYDSIEIQHLNGDIKHDWPPNLIGSKNNDPPEYKTLSYSSDDEFYDA